MKTPDYIGPETILKASATLSGRYAAAIERLIYNGMTQTSESGLRHYSTTASVGGVDLPGAKCRQIETETLLRDIRDHLESLALREVIP